MPDSDYTILIIDDNEDLVSILTQELSQEGYSVLTAGNGIDGLSLLDQSIVDLVILDIKLPEMDGFEVLKIIKKKFPAVRVVMITAHSDVYHAMESRKNGADDFIGKPYDFEEVLTVIERLRAAG